MEEGDGVPVGKTPSENVGAESVGKASRVVEGKESPVPVGNEVSSPSDVGNAVIDSAAPDAAADPVAEESPVMLNVTDGNVVGKATKDPPPPDAADDVVEESSDAVNVTEGNVVGKAMKESSPPDAADDAADDAALDIALGVKVIDGKVVGKAKKDSCGAGSASIVEAQANQVTNVEWRILSVTKRKCAIE